MIQPHTLRRAFILSTLLALLTAGCKPATDRPPSADPAPAQLPDRANPSPASKPAPGETPTKPAQPATASPAAPQAPATPASCQDAAKSIDLRAFPMLKHGEVFFKTASKIGYALAETDLPAAMSFYREKLAAAGWKIGAEQFLPDRHFGSIEATKGGFQIEVNIVKDPRSDAMHAFVENHGNVDARSLPRYPGAEPQQVYFHVAHFRSQDPLDTVAQFLHKTFKKLGWKSYTSHGGRTGNTEGETWYLRYVQGAINLNVQVKVEDGHTTIMYSTSLVKYPVPIPSNADTLDLTEDPSLRLSFFTKSAAKEVIDFYRRELPPLGWKIGDATEKGTDGETWLSLDDPTGEKFRLALLEKSGTTIVQIAPPPKSR